MLPVHHAENVMHHDRQKRVLLHLIGIGVVGSSISSKERIRMIGIVQIVAILITPPEMNVENVEQRSLTTQIAISSHIRSAPSWSQATGFVRIVRIWIIQRGIRVENAVQANLPATV
jgi:hypothetical protein